MLLILDDIDEDAKQEKMILNTLNRVDESWQKLLQDA